ncbi:ABC transporter substrate-binding protein [Deinococcus sp. Arct2-2]|uniref:ABC transporter substrate-binding protein n=1 Tax=Deinococcus sp. Arct2-2 TaxID=2568653 RepID=UPI0010A589C3|nr:ABC transporter substrate-binding protein [Deinococcus sp. Arct2-2]THF71561.1 ABC transporter substrate-binding protein [Deinococcus sp. Arct2-2]
MKIHRTKTLVSLTAALLLVTGATRLVSAQASTPTEVVFWGAWSGEGEQQILTMVNAFNASQRNIKVKYVVQQDAVTKFLTASAAGNAPDVMIWDRFETALYAPKNVLAPINSYLTRDKINTKGFYGEALRELSVGDNIYGLPLTVDARAVFYNRKLLQAAGVQPPKTWAELRAAAIKLTKRDAGGKLLVSGFALDDVGLFSMWLKQAGGSMLTPDGKKTAFNSPAGLRVLEFWDTLLNKDKVYETGFGRGEGNAQDPFVTGKIAMGYNGPWNVNAYKKYGKELDFGIIPPPAGPTGARGAVMGGFGLALTQASKNKEAGWTFIKWWLNNSTNALTWGKTSNNIPGNLAAVNNAYFQKDAFWKPITDTLKFATIRPAVAGYPPMEGQALIPNIQLFLEGKQDAKTALQKAQIAGDRILADNASK